jgi:hypothetical protein
MMRPTRFLLLPAIGVVAFAVLGVAFLASQASAANLPGPPVLYQTPAPMRPAPGLIPPSGRLAPDNPSAITFSTQDVQEYVLAHGFVGGATVPGHKLRILSIQLMTPQQADAQGAELEAYTTTTMVYVVKMKGPFYTTNASRPVPTTNNTTLTGYEIFDAHTGDTLEWGF